MCETAVKTPDSQGTYHDYVELLKLYDKNSNGTMMLAELDNILCNLGDEIPKEHVQKMFAEICDPEDEDGFFPYMPFIDRLTGRPKMESSLEYGHKELDEQTVLCSNHTTGVNYKNRSTQNAVQCEFPRLPVLLGVATSYIQSYLAMSFCIL